AISGIVVGSLLAPVFSDLFGVSGAFVVVGLVVAGSALGVLSRAPAIDRITAARSARIEDRVRVLRALPLFVGASQLTIEALASEVTETVVGPNLPVVHQGDEADDLYVVVNGTLEVDKRDAHGVTYLRATIGPG